MKLQCHLFKKNSIVLLANISIFIALSSIDKTILLKFFLTKKQQEEKKT